MDDAPRVVTEMDFKVLAQLHGMHSIPEGKGIVHKMTRGKTIELDSFYDTWIPLDDEPLHDQVVRVRITQREMERRERARQKLIEIYKQSPLYRARAEKDPTYWNNWNPGGVY